jgi:phosphate acetyltransferase
VLWLNTLIFPDLQSGNIAYKLVERMAGLRPTHSARIGEDLTTCRGCKPEDIVNTAVITGLQASLKPPEAKAYPENSSMNTEI